MSDFTPGPWVAGKEIGYGQLNGIQIRDGRGYVAAVVVADVTELYQSREANARLIAAAPALYEALDAALAVHGDSYSWGPQAKAALAQARGESNG